VNRITLSCGITPPLSQIFRTSSPRNQISVQLLLFVIVVLLFVTFWELCKINSHLKKTLSISARMLQGRASPMRRLLRSLWKQDEGEDIAEYAVMLAVILVLVVGTVRLVGSNANNAFSNVASALQ